MLDYMDGTLMKWGTICDDCMGNIHAGDRGFLSLDGTKTLCYDCASKETDDD